MSNRARQHYMGIAIKALQGILSRPSPIEESLNHWLDPKIAAQLAFGYADAMEAELLQRRPFVFERPESELLNLDVFINQDGKL